MTVCSKLSTCARFASSGTELFKQRCTVPWLIQNRHSVARIFPIRPADYTWYRMWDTLGFYYTIGFAIFFGPLIYMHIVYGPAVLADEPEGEYTPRYWEYERTIPQRWMRWLQGSPQMYHEKKLHLLNLQLQKGRWRLIERRVRQLVFERGDYKAWYYLPVTSKWVEWGYYHQQRLEGNFNAYDHYTL